MTDELAKERTIKLNKIEKMRSLGICPYPYRFERTHETIAVINDFERLATTKNNVRLAGRLVAKREHGKTVFGHIADGQGKIQIYLRQDFLGERFSLLDLLDIGDFIGVEGEVFKTKTGEITILVKSYEFLGKALRPMPEKWHGLKDVETRYRARYLDLIANPIVKQIFLTRTKIINLIRQFLNERGFVEVETPILQPIYGGAAAKPFQTFYNALDQNMFLRISDELYLKRLIIGGIEKVYEIGKDFRNEGLSPLHNPEFTQVEVYEAYADYNDMMRLVSELFKYIALNLFGTTTITYQGKSLDLGRPWRCLKFVDALKEKLGEDPLSHSLASLKKLGLKFGIETEGVVSMGKMLDKLFSKLVQDEIIEPTFVCDYPRITTPLAKTHRTNPELVERFEPVICGIELGNAFSEATDPVEQRKRFEEQIRLQEEYATLDEDFITALEYGMPPCGGLGLGIDRMVMLFTNTASIREVILFPSLRNPESPAQSV
jgi:lysyl-tRNA synthetase class 2|uniref:Lysine--tRNA ligase n=1 Tax=candidate division WOR-3 bacterium TaxID=2052148 RepID=A0A7C6EHG0_UNCW3